MKKFIISGAAGFFIFLMLCFVWQTTSSSQVLLQNMDIHLTENIYQHRLISEIASTEPIAFHAESPIKAPRIPLRQISSEIESLRQLYNNQDIIGHLKIEGTRINYPVTQYADNDFYLYHDIQKQPHHAGWVFLDRTNSIARPDRNTVIYGHNMMDGSRFRDMLKFTCPDFFATHRYITFDTAYNTQQWEIFAFYRTDISFNYIQTIFPSQNAFGELVAEMKSHSWHDVNVNVTAYDRILTLSTCAGAGATNFRYVLNARLIQ